MLASLNNVAYIILDLDVCHTLLVELNRENEITIRRETVAYKKTTV